MDRAITNKKFRKLMAKAGLQDVDLVKGYGYHYIMSSNVYWYKKIEALWESSIYVCHFEQMKPERWVEEIKALFNN